MKTKTLLIVAVAIVAVTFLGNSFFRWLGLKDTAGIEVGMSYTEYVEKIDKEDRLDFWNYSIFINSHNIPVLIRCEDEKIVQIHPIDLSKADPSQEKFEKIAEGMTLSQVCALVGPPGGIAKDDDRTLAYNVRNEIIYLIRFVETDSILYVESVSTKSMQ